MTQQVNELCFALTFPFSFQKELIAKLFYVKRASVSSRNKNHVPPSSQFLSVPVSRGATSFDPFISKVYVAISWPNKQLQVLDLNYIWRVIQECAFWFQLSTCQSYRCCAAYSSSCVLSSQLIYKCLLFNYNLICLQKVTKINSRSVSSQRNIAQVLQQAEVMTFSLLSYLPSFHSQERLL